MSEGEAHSMENRSFLDILKSLVGHAVTVVNPESYEQAHIGHQIKASFYRAKLSAIGTDFIVLLTEDKKPGKEKGDPVKQFMPLARIKRISMTKTERLIHI